MSVQKQAAWLVLATAFMTLMLSACGGGPLQQAQTFEQKLAYSYATHTAILQTAAVGVETGQLSASEGADVLKLADDSKALLDSARLAIGVGDISTAEGQLALATNILTQLQTYLNSRGVKK